MKTKEELEDYLKALSRCLYHLEDTSKDHMSNFEYIIFQEWKKVSKQLKRKNNTKIQFKRCNSTEFKI